MIRVLVVSSSGEVVRRIDEALGGQGFHVAAAASGDEAVRLLEGERFGLAVIDAAATSAAQLIGLLKSKPSTSDTPLLVLIDPSAGDADKLGFLKEGADDFLSKPIDPVALLARANLLARMKSLSDSLTMVSRPARVMERELGELKVPVRRVRRKVAIMFSDIRGFTRFSERVPATRVFDILNMHLAQQAETIVKHKGLVDKYSGDEVMAFFQGPYMARRAVHAAVEIIDGLKQIEAEGRKDSIRVGIGINTGTVVLGDIGSPRRMTYTAIGDNVNLAARLCGIASYLQILISESTYEQVRSDPSLEFSKLPPARVKGKVSPVKIYEVRRSASAEVSDAPKPSRRSAMALAKRTRKRR